MTRILTIFTLAIAFSLTTSQSQSPAGAAPVAAGAPGSPLSVLQQLKAIRDANAKLIEQQAQAIKQLDEMEKQAEQLKIFAKRA